MGNYDDNEWQMLLYRASITKSKELGYTIKLYGCNFAYKKLNDLIDEYVDISDNDFILTDDLKLYIHSVENLDCITIDGDLILNSKLSFPIECDIIYERRGIVKPNGDSKMQKHLNMFKKYNVETAIPYFNYNNRYVCGVGILKFNNQEAKDLFLESYYSFREYFINTIRPNNEFHPKDDPAIIICEYMFGCILGKTDYIGKWCNEINDYTHYMSLTKFTPAAWRHVDSILHPNKKMIQ